MPFSQFLILKIPLFYLGLIIVGGAALLSIAGLFIVRRYVSHHKLKGHHDVAGPIFGTLGVIYAVLLAFVVIVVWQNFDRSDMNVKNEANCLSDLYRDAQAFPSPFKQEARALFKDYARTVINDEWPMLASGKESGRVEMLMEKMWSAYSNYQPKNPTEQIFFEESVRRLNELNELRMTRLVDSRTGIHPLLWLVLIAGAIATVSFVFLFGVENLKAQIIMTVLLAMLISLILLTILTLDFPFTGEVSISSSAFKTMAVSQ